MYTCLYIVLTCKHVQTVHAGFHPGLFCLGGERSDHAKHTARREVWGYSPPGNV